MKSLFAPAFILFSATILLSCNSADKETEKKAETKAPKLKEENISYKLDSLTMDGYIVYDENIVGKRPAVLVVHEWWGLNDYIKSRTRQLAELGYIAMAVDMYGNGQRADNPDLAGKLSGPFYTDRGMTKKRFDAGLDKLKTYPQTDMAKIGAIGYCFGGNVVLNMAKMGEDLKGVVSFHGILGGVPADKNLLRSKMLVCHGNDDKFVSPADVAAFRKQLDSIGANYIFKGYDGATHAFTNPAATEIGKKFNLPIAYNAAADTASWNEMKTFFSGLFK